MYNSALSFTSIGVNVDQEVTGTSGVYTFRIHGEMYHRIGTLLPNSETPPFLQNYNKCYMILTHMLIYFGKLEIC